MVERPALKRARVAARVLSEQRAWEILSVVSAPLRGRVRLVSTGKEYGDLEVVHTYDWLEISVPSPRAHAAPRVANALAWVEEIGQICALWHVLACCPGFRAHENAAFWKRLVDSLADSRVNATTDGRSTSVPSDGLRFFELHGWESVFPRFLLRPAVLEALEITVGAELVLNQDNNLRLNGPADWLDNVVRGFLGLRHPLYKHTDELRCYVIELRAYADLEMYWNKEVEMGVRLESNLPLTGLDHTIPRLVADITEMNRVMFATRARVAPPSHLPRVRLTSLVVGSRNWSTLRPLEVILQACPIEVSELSLTLGERVTASELGKSLCNAHRLGAGTLARLALNLNGATIRQIHAVFSTLPTMSIRALRLFTRIHGLMLPDIVWTWLAYAVYHPWSTWSHLDLETLDMFEPTADALSSARCAQAAMYRMAHGTDDDDLIETSRNDGYAFVRLRASTKGFDSRNLSRQVRITPSEGVEETAIIHSSIDDVDALPGAVCVVLRGYGVCWVARQSVTDLWRLPARLSNITHLRFGSRRRHILTTQPPKRFPEFRAIEHLDLIHFEQIEARQLRAILQQTPKLKALCVASTCDLFSTWSPQTTVDMSSLAQLRLHSLRLVDPHRGVGPNILLPSDAAWATCLRDLREFVCDFQSPYFRSIKSQFTAVITRGHTLEYIVWRNKRGGRDTPINGYVGWRAASRAQLKGFLPDAEHARHPFSYKSRIAFLSAMKRTQQDGRSVLDRLGQDVVQKIYAFATTDVQRHIWIDSHA